MYYPSWFVEDTIVPEAIVFTIKILFFLTFVLQRHFLVADPDPQIRGKGRAGGQVQGGHPDPEIRGSSVSKKIFSALRASVWSKNRGGGGAGSPGPLPRSATVFCLVCRERDTVVS